MTGRVGTLFVDGRDEAFAAEDLAGWEVWASSAEGFDDAVRGAGNLDGSFAVDAPAGRRMVWLQSSIRPAVAVIGEAADLDLARLEVGHPGAPGTREPVLRVELSASRAWLQQSVDVSTGGAAWWDVGERRSGSYDALRHPAHACP